jgi:hypothetical protein
VVVYPDIPSVSFLTVISKDSADALDNPVKRVTVTFHLIDGNGDIGLSPSDTTGAFNKDSAFFYNLFLQEYKRDSSGTFTEVPAPDGLRRYRIPDLTPTGQNKTLIADVSVAIDYPYSETNPLPFKDFRYIFYVVDRSLNLSNRDTTDVVSW